MALHRANHWCLVKDINPILNKMRRGRGNSNSSINKMRLA